jgi:hypothetical protein
MTLAKVANAIRNNERGIPTYMPREYYEVTGNYLKALKEAIVYYEGLSDAQRELSGMVERIEKGWGG